MKKITVILCGLVAALAAVSAFAKLPAPVLSDEAKAKAAEAAAKTAWTGKTDAYQLCRAQDRVAAYALKSAKAAGKEAKPATETPACADPGPFAYTPAVAATPRAAAPATVAAAPAAAPAVAAMAKKP